MSQVAHLSGGALEPQDKGGSGAVEGLSWGSLEALQARDKQGSSSSVAQASSGLG